MKILIISDFAAPYRIAVFKGLSSTYDVDVFFNIAKSEQRNSKWYAKSDESFRFFVFGSKETDDRYKECIKRINEYCAVICYDPWARRSRALQRLCIRKRIPYILNADGAVKINTSFPKKQIKSFYVKRAALCFAGCFRAKQYFRAYGAVEKRIVQHNFSSLFEDQILKSPYSLEQKKRYKEQLGIKAIPTFITVGQFIHRKGFDLLLKSWKKVEGEAQLYVIGGGPLNDQYEQFIRENKLSNVYVEDFKIPAELFKYYQASDVFLMPTREDIWGLVVNEAMAVGLPVISSNQCTSANELVVQGQNGFTYECENIDELASHINYMIEHQDLWTNFAQKSLEVVQNYTIEGIVASHLNSLEELLINRRSCK